jgi:ABC-type transport system involved in multi-copper enzyme maturation permease subunit
MEGRTMVWKIAAKEFLLNLMTFKFVVGTILCVVLVAIFVPVLAKDYRQRLQQYDQRVADNEAKLRQVKAYRVLTPTVYRRPQVLSVFSQGMEKRLADSAKIGFGTRPDFDKIPEINAGPTEVNPYLSIFPSFDFLLIFKIVMSALALLVAYDVVSREREQGTLSLTLSYRISRAQVLLGKLLAGLLTLAVPATIAFLVGLLLLLSSPVIALGGSDWARIGLMYLASLLFVLAVYNVGLLFSSLTGSSSLALILGLFFWVLSIIVIPDATVYVARRFLPVATVEAKDEQIAGIQKLFLHEWHQEQAKLPPGGAANATLGPFHGGNGDWFILVCDPAEAKYWEKGASFEVSFNVKYARKFWEVEHDYVESLLRQTRLAKAIGRLSPACLYDNTMNALAGTDLTDYQSWTERVRTYREMVLTYIRNKTDDLRSPSYITQCTQAEQVAWAKGDKFAEEASKVADKHTVALNLEDLPRFTYGVGIAQGLQRAAADLIVLLLFNLLMFSLSFVAFLRYDVR